jgi:hypothetical protein
LLTTRSFTNDHKIINVNDSISLAENGAKWKPTLLGAQYMAAYRSGKAYLLEKNGIEAFSLWLLKMY